MGKAAGKAAGKAVARKRPGWMGNIVALVVFIAAIVAWQWTRAPESPGPPAEEAVTTAGTAQMETPRDGGTASLPRREAAGPVIEAVRITPANPVATEAITAVAFLIGGDTGGAEFTYQWKRNGEIIPGATADVLKAPSLKRGDRVSVEVRARRHGMTSPPVESQVVISNQPPSLEMKIMTPRVLLGEPFEIQLTAGGKTAKGEGCVFALQPPLVAGMTIDARTGRIVWTPARAYTGKVLFGAAVTDADGNSASRVFELDLGTASGAAPERQP